ncbi:MAG: serine/threonine-protein kinase [Verrucomicrobiales bacterium]
MSGFTASDCCDVCGEPLKGRGVDGTCQSCLLVQPVSALWDPREPPSAEEISRLLPRFEIHEQLGRGALGIVFRATDSHLKRTVAVKAMTANSDNPEFAQRFEREAAAMANLNHPHIVTVYDYATAGSLHFLIMEWMEGGTLDDEMGGKRKLPVPRAVEVIGQICDALQYAHSEGVIHRDVKPGNILLDREGTAKLSDFGLVKGLLQEEFTEVALTRTDMAIGTPLYMAPEQMIGSTEVDHRADIYSAGAVLYEMMTGEVPKGRHRPASTFPDVPRFVNGVIDRAMHKEPEGRYEAAKEMKDDLRRGQMAKKRWLVRLGAAAVFVALTLTAGKAFSPWRDEQPSEVEPQWSDPKEAIDGLPLGSFESEVDLSKWQKIADYNFKQGLGDMAHKQGAFTLVEDASIKKGQLVLTEIDDSGAAELKRDTTRPLLGLAIHYRFKPDEYLGVRVRNIDIVEFAHYSVSGLRLVSKRWGDPRPTVKLGDYQPFAPAGVIEPRLEPGQWHEVWLVIGDGCRLWIDGEPVYHSDDPMIEAWANWSGDETARLAFTGFSGLVDYVEIWERF